MFRQMLRTVNNTKEGRIFAPGYQKDLSTFGNYYKAHINPPLLKGLTETHAKSPYWKMQTRTFSSEENLNQTEVIFDSANNDPLVNLEKEAVLDPEITAATNRTEASNVPKNILITGATGFVGKHLLIELLNTTNANIYCLIRETSITNAEKRLEESLLSHNLWQKAYSARIIPILGDISRPYLGMQEAEFNGLSKIIDNIYHSAAVMNFDSYYDLKQANVIGTKEVLRFACMGRLKRVHHISTANVFSEVTCLKPRTIDETTSIKNEKHYSCAGYPSSKWIAEELVFIAMKRGIPCNIYRLGLVIWNDETGKCEETQWFYKLIKSCLMLHAFPTELNNLICMIPVNMAAKAISFLSQQKTINETYHIWEPKSYSLEDISKVFHHETFIPLKPAFEWLECLAHYNNTQEELPIIPILRGESSQNNALIKQRFMGIFNAPTFNYYRSESTWGNLTSRNTLTPFKGVKIFVAELYKNIKSVNTEMKQEVLFGGYSRTINSLDKQNVTTINPTESGLPNEQAGSVGGKPKVTP